MGKHRSMLCLFGIVVSLVCASTVAGSVSDVAFVRADIPQFKEGDNVYVSVTGWGDSWSLIYLTAVGKREFLNGQYLEKMKDTPYLIPHDEAVEVLIWTQTGTNRAIMRMNAKDLLDNLAKRIRENPDDRQQWRSTWISEGGKGREVVRFEFAGVQRYFSLHSIVVPRSSALTRRVEYSGGGAPRLSVRIAVDGKEQRRVLARARSWQIGFSQDVHSQFELREWADETVTFRILDADTWIRERHLSDILGVKFADIRGGLVREELGSFANQADAIVLEFREVK